MQTPRTGEGPRYDRRGADGGHHGRFERHRARRRARACAARAAGRSCSRRAAQEPLAAAAAELSATAVRCDVTEDADVAALVAAAREAGGCDLLVHAAGASARKGVLDADLATYRASFEVNYIGLVRVATAFWPLLEAAPRPARAGRVRRRHRRAGPLGPVRLGQERGALVGALLRRRRARARRGGHDRQPGARCTTPGFPQDQLLRSRWGSLLVVDAERCAERLLAAADRRAPEVYVPQWWRVAAALQGAAPGLMARVAERAWRRDPRLAPEAASA